MHIRFTSQRAQKRWRTKSIYAQLICNEHIGSEEIEEMEEMEEDSTEIGRQRNKERHMEQAICAHGRCPSRPVEEASRPARSTGVHGRAQEGAVDQARSTD